MDNPNGDIINTDIETRNVHGVLRKVEAAKGKPKSENPEAEHDDNNHYITYVFFPFNKTQTRCTLENARLAQ